MDTLSTESIILDMSPPHGIGGLDPREDASVEAGDRNIRLCSEAIDRETRMLLQSLQEEKCNFDIERIEPGSWWMV
jgi:hypothetical protein